MDANELRIGNIISVYGTNGNPDGWSEFAIKAEHIQTCIDRPEWFKPIEITKGSVKNLGFSPLNEYYKNTYKIDSRLEVSFWQGISEVEIDFGHHSEGGENLEHIKYIHQLQNLYYLLFNKEI